MSVEAQRHAGGMQLAAVHAGASLMDLAMVVVVAAKTRNSNVAIFIVAGFVERLVFKM